MPVFNYESDEINTKIVYYGPGLSGKTTNLEHIYSKLPRENKGKMVSMKTRTDRTLFFDFLPIEVGGINSMTVRFLLYTVPGQVYYNATRKLVLKGVDAVVFVADSAPDRMADNKESLRNLEANLNDLGMALKEIPWVIQYNKRDLPERMDVAVMEKELNTQDVPSFEAIATEGKGVYETFEAIGGLVFGRMQRELQTTLARSSKIGSGEEHNTHSIDVEVVAKGKSMLHNSETDEGESIHHAEERAEEHESVSEFVDSVLREKDVQDESIDMGATRDGYEDYGHLVELKDDEDGGKTDSAENMEIINSPLVKPAYKRQYGEEAPEHGEPGVAAPAEETRIVHVPIAISREDVDNNVPIKVLLEITVK
jgi:signal recognition particle receptor subunit beta